MKSGFMIAWHQRKFTKNDGLWWYHFFLSVFFAGRTVYRGGLEAHRWPLCTTGTETRISGSWIGTRIWGASAGAMRRRFWEVGIVLFRCRIHMNEFFLAHGIEANAAHGSGFNVSKASNPKLDSQCHWHQHMTVLFLEFSESFLRTREWV